MDQPAAFDATPDNMVEAPAQITPAKAVVRVKPKRTCQLDSQQLRVSIGLMVNPADMPGGYTQRDLDRVDLHPVAAITLKMLHSSLVAQGETLADGTPITRPQHTVTYLLERLALELPQRVLDDALEESMKHG